MSHTPEAILNKIKNGTISPPIAFNYELIVVDGTVKQLNPTLYKNAKYALCKLTSTIASPAYAAMMLEFYLPVSSTNGIPITDGTTFDITGAQNLAGFNITQVTAGTHKLYVQYFY